MKYPDESYIRSDKILSFAVILVYFYSVLSWGFLGFLNALRLVEKNEMIMVLYACNIFFYLFIILFTISLTIKTIKYSTIILLLLFIFSFLLTLVLLLPHNVQQ